MGGSTRGRLIIVWGLPGSGKTTVAISLEDRRDAIRLSPDDWMDALRINLHDEKSRARIETLQWTLGSDFSNSVARSSLNGGRGPALRGTSCESALVRLELPSNCITCRHLPLC